MSAHSVHGVECARDAWVARRALFLPIRLLVVQTGERVDQAKVFKAYAVPQGLCANLINALKMLAKQQKDGDGLLRNIGTNPGKGSRKGLTDGLRESSGRH